MQSGVTNALHGARAHAPTHSTRARGQRPRTATRTAVREVCEPPEIGSAVACRIGGVQRHTVPVTLQLQSQAGAPCATHGAPQYRATRRLPGAGSAEPARRGAGRAGIRSAGTLPSELSARLQPDIATSPRNRLTRSGPRLKSTRSGSVTGNSHLRVVPRLGSQVAVSQQRGGAKKTDRMGRRHGRLATLSRTPLARAVSFRRTQSTASCHDVG